MGKVGSVFLLMLVVGESRSIDQFLRLAVVPTKGWIGLGH